jgi:Ser-tRNA(Ala) deacylase AlaX
MQTKLIYMEYMQQYTCDAKVLDVKTDKDIISIILDQTVFYPQGGGQPYDIGTISSDNVIFQVKEVRYIDGEVQHIGTFKSSSFKIGNNVSCEIDVDRRKINTRLHSIGHLIDLAVKELQRSWIPMKGYHFPEGAYIEYGADIKGRRYGSVSQRY